MPSPAVNILVFRWAGSWGPMNINVPCGECSLTGDVIQDTIKNELQGVPVELDIRDWLSEWWKPLLKGGWHAPIVMVNGKVISQGRALNRGLLTQAVIEAYAGQSELSSNVMFGKFDCPHCLRAKEYLDAAGIEYQYQDVVRQPRALYEMLARVKPIIGPKTPVTVPQIWLNGSYVGGANELTNILKRQVTPNHDRGQCSLS